MGATLTLGNSAPLQDGEPANIGRTVTVVELPDSASAADDIRDFWPVHSADPVQWVECDDENLAAAVAASFNCAVGRPTDW